jgi:hypothetical protein
MIEGRALAFRIITLAAIAGSVMVIQSACVPDGRPCSPGDYIDCTCADGRAGGRICDDQGTGYVAACDCTILVPPLPEAGAELEAGVEASTDSGLCSAPTNRPLFCPCTDGTQCANGICHGYATKGQLCTKACTSDTDCQPASPKCSPMAHVCAAP